MILPRQEITRRVREGILEITPFYPDKFRTVRGMPVVSFGLSEAGYDLSLAPDYETVHTTTRGAVLDVKDAAAFQACFMPQRNEREIIIPPNSFILARSVEHIGMPNDVLGIVEGKSTYARAGVVCNVTPIEPGWHGYITLELSNTGPLPVRLYPYEGVAQLVFFQLSQPTDRPYTGQYQGQPAGVVFPKVGD